MNAKQKFDQALHAHRQGQLEQAFSLYQDTLKFDAQYVDAYINMGVLLRALNQPQAALASYDKAIELRPGSAQAHYNRGNVLNDLQQYQAALESFNRSIVINMSDAQAYSNRATALHGLGRFQAAVSSCDKAIALEPKDAQFYLIRANALHELGQSKEAVQSYERAIELRSNYVDAYVNRGVVLRDLHLHTQALESFHQALALSPKSANAHWSLSLCLLQLGQFEWGWQQYEWRWQDKLLDTPVRNFGKPLWLGKESLDGKTILLHWEQGLGDTLQFCRYAKLVAQCGARVVLEVQSPLVRLLRGLEGVSALLAYGEPLPAFDYHCPLLSLPLAFETRLETIPPVAFVRSTSLHAGPVKKIGFVWHGGSGHKNDKRRSITFQQMLSVVSDQFEWVSLQKEVTPQEREQLAQHAHIKHVGDELSDFADTAQQLESLDLVVTVDTSMAHLAGALNKPVWVLLPFNPDWRWLLERDDSPWYPSMRLFRQRVAGDWDGVLGEICKALRLIDSSH